MKQSKKELIEFSELERRRQLQRYGQYECFATLGRLEGYCEDYYESGHCPCDIYNFAARHHLTIPTPENR